MARYIDADAFEQRLADKDIFFPALYKNELDSMPTADVVLRSELAVTSFRDAATIYALQARLATAEAMLEFFLSKDKIAELIKKKGEQNDGNT